MNRPIFLDSSFWIILRDPDDSRQGRAQNTMHRLVREKNVFVITGLVLAETHAYFARRRSRAEQILDDYEKNPVLQSEQVTSEDENAAIELLRQHADKSYSYCDAISFVLMRRKRIDRALSFDRHFRQIGEFEIIS